MSITKIEEPQVLSFKYLLWGIGAVSLTVLILINSAVLYNEYRSKKIISEYSNETLNFVSTRKTLFKQLFTITPESCQNEYEQEREKVKSQKDYIQSDMCLSAQQILSAIGVEALKNSSAVAYLAVQGHNVVLIEASGKYHPSAPLTDQYIYSRGRWGENTYLELNEYLTQGKELSGFWQDFISYISGKEVLVPVDIDDLRVGYIFRGVIER
jgi:hypothetical protein